MSEYTSGKITVSKITKFDYALVDSDGMNVGNIRLSGNVEKASANAHRLALCWNTHDKLVEALEDIARGKLQNPDFEKYAVNKARQTLKEATQ